MKNLKLTLQAMLLIAIAFILEPVLKKSIQRDFDRKKSIAKEDIANMISEMRAEV